MTVAKSIEITSSSTKSFDDAVSTGVKKASESVTDIKSAWVKDQSVVVSGNEITEWRVNMKITFVIA